MSELHLAASEFLYREAALLDEKRYNEWLDLFTESGHYWIPNDPSITEVEGTLALINDNRARLEERVWRLGTSYAHAQIPESLTTHLVTNVRTLEESEDSITVESKFAVHEMRRTTHNIYTGTYTHHLVRRSDDFKIESKRVDMIQAQTGLGNVSILI